jgi:hypothetical protein
VEKVLKRGLDELSMESVVEIGKHLKKATNVQAGGFGYFE